jgi:hypothetical protein
MIPEQNLTDGESGKWESLIIILFIIFIGSFQEMDIDFIKYLDGQQLISALTIKEIYKPLRDHKLMKYQGGGNFPILRNGPLPE